ncbi:MAG TPA: phenylacetic acid degradation protein PaaN [Microlunatus sp.]
MSERLQEAREAIRRRDYYSAFPESPSPRIYGETAAAEGLAAFDAHRGAAFAVSTPGAEDEIAGDRSPYGLSMDIRYPRVTKTGLTALLDAAHAATPAWRDAGPERRVAVCLDIVDALHHRVFELANAVQHTSGQPFVMAFQAGGTHALDRALEAIGYAAEAMDFHPPRAGWTKPGRGGDVVLDKTFTVVPRGVGLVIGCRTFPTWNSYPGLFADLVTGNPVIVKPHPEAVLPLAITVQAAQQVLTGEGFDPHLIMLAAEDDGDRLARELAVDPRVRLIDYTGGSAFGEWLEGHATQAQVFAEKAGVNATVLHSTDDFVGLCDNLAFTLALYSGQMCTTTQNFFLPVAGLQTEQGPKSVADVAASIGGAIERLLGEDGRAVEVLGAIAAPEITDRADRAGKLGDVVVPSRTIIHPRFPEAMIMTPTMIEVGEDSSAYAEECFGPVSFLITAASVEEALTTFGRTMAEGGAMTAGVYSTDPDVINTARRLALQAGVSLSENLTGPIYVNQSAAFSDFHGTGANPAANAALVDLAFVANRFHVVQSRRLA